MQTTIQPLSSDFQLVAHGMRELHRLYLLGLNDSNAADEVRDLMDAPWDRLTSIEQERLGGLSADLYTISDPEKKPRPKNPQVQSNLKAFQKAKQQGNFDKAFDILRRWRDYIDLAEASFYRGNIWRGLGDFQTATLFFEHAWKLKKDDDTYLYVYLDSLQSFDVTAAKNISFQIIAKPENFPATGAVIAASILFEAEKSEGETLSTQEVENLIKALEHARLRLVATNIDALRPTYQMCLTLLAALCERLGRLNQAIQYYTMGLQENPADDMLLSGRGLLQYGHGEAAITISRRPSPIDRE